MRYFIAGKKNTRDKSGVLKLKNLYMVKCVVQYVCKFM